MCLVLEKRKPCSDWSRVSVDPSTGGVVYRKTGAKVEGVANSGRMGRRNTWQAGEKWPESWDSLSDLWGRSETWSQGDQARWKCWNRGATDGCQGVKMGKVSGFFFRDGQRTWRGVWTIWNTLYLVFFHVCPSTHAVSNQVNIEQQEGAQTEVSMLVVDKAWELRFHLGWDFGLVSTYPDCKAWLDLRPLKLQEPTKAFEMHQNRPLTSFDCV